MCRTCMPISISTRRLWKKLPVKSTAAIFDPNAIAAFPGGFFVTHATLWCDAVPRVFNTVEEKFVEKRALTLVTFCQQPCLTFCTASGACRIVSNVPPLKVNLDSHRDAACCVSALPRCRRRGQPRLYEDIWRSP